MPRDLEQLLVDSAVKPSSPVDLDAIERGVRRRRAARWASRGVGAAAVVAVAVAVVVSSPPARPSIDTPVTRPSPPAPTASVEAPSQSPEDAARDGVVPALARLPFAQRVWITPPEHGGDRIVTDEGVWVASVLDPDAIAGGHEVLGDASVPDAAQGRDYVRGDYGEVLLLDPTETRILRAYPLPLGVPPQRLTLSDDAVYCSHQGDGALPDSMLCRIDRTTLDWSVRVFPYRGDVDPTDLGRGAVAWLPSNWVVDGSGAQPLVYDLLATRGRLLGSTGSPSDLSAFDPVTLEAVDPATVGAARDFGRVVSIDGVPGAITVHRFEFTDDPTEDGGYRISDLGETVTYPVGDDVEVWMTLYWDYQCCPEVFDKPLSCDGFGRIWDADATTVYPEDDVTYSRDAYYRLLLLDGEVVRIEQQYLP